MPGQSDLFVLPYIGLSLVECERMWSADDEAAVRLAHGRYFQALGSGNMDGLAEIEARSAIISEFV